MTREIKFRAWDKSGKVMHNDFQFIKSGNEGNDWIVFVSDKNKLTDNPHPFDNPYFSQQIDVMQYTGINDSNGIPVYEGDTVEWFKDGAQEPRIGDIEWDEEISGFYINGNFIDCALDIYMEIKVIGNIYENHDILLD